MYGCMSTVSVQKDLGGRLRVAIRVVYLQQDSRFISAQGCELVLSLLPNCEKPLNVSIWVHMFLQSYDPVL